MDNLRDELTKLSGRSQTAGLKKSVTVSWPDERNAIETVRAGDCPLCGGAKWYHVQPEPGQVFDPHYMHDWQGHVLVPCRICNSPEKRTAKLQAHLREMCQLKGDERGFTFADYWTHRHGGAALVAAVKVLDQHGWLTLHGNFGTGKTYLLCAVVNEALNRNMLAVYSTMADLLDHLRAAYQPKHEVDFDPLWDSILRCPVLCLDEVEKWNPTPWAEEKVTAMLKDRYRTWQSTTTVMATNDFAHCPGWLKSLMLDGRFAMVKLTDADVRSTLERDA